ncbi:hypothetical protein QGP82_08590 [Leptothoe sp. LEGE 181152]|nr:hypothetical protein [Leptothoe sp. LEGE 181152]
MAGRDIDLGKDFPPDLIEEVNITHTDIDNLQLYRAIGVSDFGDITGEFSGFISCRALLMGAGEKSDVSADTKDKTV